MFAVIMGSYALLAPWLQELTGIAAALVMGLFSYFFIFQNRQLTLRPWLPYLLLVGLLLMPKLISPLGEALKWAWTLTDLFGTGLSASLQPFRSPLIPFLAVSAFALALSRSGTFNLRPVLSKSLSVFIILFPSLAITQLMLNSGAGGPSMIEHIAGVFVRTGDAYPAVSPFIGVVGAFMTGSTTVSNVIFGPVQLAAAQELGFSASVILGQQLAGASLGNAVCLFNIIAAAAVAGVKDFQLVLRKTLLPIFVAGLLVALLGYGWLAWG
jgi:lactate permease